MILNALYLNGDCPLQPTFYNVQALIPDIHIAGKQSVGPNRFENNVLGRLIKTHHRNCDHYKNAIYLARHPVAVMTSYFHYMKQINNLDMSEHQFLRNKSIGINAWRKHVDSWINEQRHWQRIHLVRYEDLATNPVDTLASLFQNLGCDIEAKIFERAVSFSNEENMRKTELVMANHNPGYKLRFVKSHNSSLSNEAKEYILENSKAETRILGYS